jgi:hypothetical protein
MHFPSLGRLRAFVGKPEEEQARQRALFTFFIIALLEA